MGDKMRFFLALLAFACYSSFVQAEGNLTKQCFNMVVVQTTAEVVPTTKATPPVIKATPATTVAYRAAQGHSHTCPKCGTVWDHAVTAGHNCPNCGTYQNVQDRVPKMIAVTTTVRTTPTPQPVIRSSPVTVQFNRYTASSNCANGNCQYR